MVVAGIVGGLLISSNPIEAGLDEDLQFLAWMMNTTKNLLVYMDPI